MFAVSLGTRQTSGIPVVVKINKSAELPLNKAQTRIKKKKFVWLQQFADINKNPADPFQMPSTPVFNIALISVTRLNFAEREATSVAAIIFMSQTAGPQQSW